MRDDAVTARVHGKANFLTTPVPRFSLQLSQSECDRFPGGRKKLQSCAASTLRVLLGKAVYIVGLLPTSRMTQETRRVPDLSDKILGRPCDARVVAVVELIRRDLSRRISIHDLSVFVRLSPSGLRRIFRRQMGSSIGKWQKNERLRAASALLCGTRLTVKEINAAIGYHDLSHFVRDFELAFGLSPARFRRANVNLSAERNPLC